MDMVVQFGPSSEKECAEKMLEFYRDSVAMAVDMDDGEWIQQLVAEVDNAMEKATETKLRNALRKIAETLGMSFFIAWLSLMRFVSR